jgi:hypothetical protein
LDRKFGTDAANPTEREFLIFSANKWEKRRKGKWLEGGVERGKGEGMGLEASPPAEVKTNFFGGNKGQMRGGKEMGEIVIRNPWESGGMGLGGDRKQADKIAVELEGQRRQQFSLKRTDGYRHPPTQPLFPLG